MMVRSNSGEGCPEGPSSRAADVDSTDVLPEGYLNPFPSPQP